MFLYAIPLNICALNAPPPIDNMYEIDIEPDISCTLKIQILQSLTQYPSRILLEDRSWILA